jgi:hypothetical protein
VVAWYERMGQEVSATIYAERFPNERPDADVRNTGSYRFLVRGVEKVNAVALWHAIAYNFLQIPRLMLAQTTMQNQSLAGTHSEPTIKPPRSGGAASPAAPDAASV